MAKNRYTPETIIHKLRGHQSDGVSSCLQLTRPMMSTGTSLHANLTAWLGPSQQNIEPLCPAQLALPHRCPRPINTV
jgi:hypothetical protein